MLSGIPKIPHMNNISDIPKTPRPGSISNSVANGDFKTRFIGIILFQTDENHTIEDYLNEYDYYELYSETKQYTKRVFSASYKRVMREYQNYL